MDCQEPFISRYPERQQELRLCIRDHTTLIGEDGDEHRYSEKWEGKNGQEVEEKIPAPFPLPPTSSSGSNLEVHCSEKRQNRVNVTSP